MNGQIKTTSAPHRNPAPFISRGAGNFKRKALIVFLFLVFPSLNAAESIGERFSGESFTYELGFWIFDGVARAHIKMEKTGGVYTARLTAYTTGLVSAIRRRTDTYTARLEEVEGGRRFRTIFFEENVDVGEKTRRFVSTFDYKTRTMKWQRWRMGKLRAEGSMRIPLGEYFDDPLGAFYNFRAGVYGPVGHGREFRIRTFPRGKEKREEIYLKLEKTPDNPGLLARAKLAPELFDSASGDIEIEFDEAFVPVRAVAKDIFFFGDVRGVRQAANPLAR
jgi:hypothetical protein